MSTAPKQLLTEEQYLVRERKANFRSEFYRGEMFAMAGASREHNLITGNVARHLGNQLDERPCEVYSTDMKVRITPTGLFAYPDVAIVCGGPQFSDDEEDVLLNPTVLVEVLSPSTSSYDRGDKQMHYRQLGSLQEILLIEQEYPAVEQYVRQSDGTWLLKSTAGIEATIEAASVGCKLSLAQIYARVEFPPDARRPIRPAR